MSWEKTICLPFIIPSQVRVQPRMGAQEPRYKSVRLPHAHKMMINLRIQDSLLSLTGHYCWKVPKRGAMTKMELVRSVQGGRAGI